MRYTVTDVTTSHILVRFEDGTMAQVMLNKNWDLSRIEEEISKYISVKTQHEDIKFENLDSIPLSVGDSNDIDCYAEIEKKRLEKEQEEVIKYTKTMLDIDKARLVDYRELREDKYPCIPDQLDALYWARNGVSTHLDVIDEQIRKVKETYPKDMNPIRADVAYPEKFKEKEYVIIDGEKVEVPNT